MADADDSATQLLLDSLADLGELRARKMFGGVGVYCDGTMFAIVHDGVAYFKTGADNVDDYEDAGAPPFQPVMRGKKTTMSYHEVPADVLDDRERLAEWALRSIAVARG